MSGINLTKGMPKINLTKSTDTGDIANGNIPNGSIPNGSVPNGSVPNGSVPNGNAPNGSVPNGSVPNGNVPNGNVPNGKNKWIALLLAFFIGGIGAHKFYEGKTGLGITYLVITIVGLLTGGLLNTILGTVILVECVMYLFKSNPYNP